MHTAVLSRSALMLNRNWQPVGVATVARALTMLFNDSARVVDPKDYQLYTWTDWSRLLPEEGEPFVQAVRFKLRVPEVISLTRYDRVPSSVVTFSRRNVFKRDQFRCQYCAKRCDSEDLTIDHVLPRSQGGTSNWTNCVLACIECNKRKADRTPDQALMPLRKTPVRPRWRPVYATKGARVDSWEKFLSEAYWNVELES